jgi:hypothetical protein
MTGIVLLPLVLAALSDEERGGEGVWVERFARCDALRIQRGVRPLTARERMRILLSDPFDPLNEVPEYMVGYHPSEDHKTWLVGIYRNSKFVHPHERFKWILIHEKSMDPLDPGKLVFFEEATVGQLLPTVRRYAFEMYLPIDPYLTPQNSIWEDWRRDVEYPW